jgi:hypothetical protein
MSTSAPGPHLRYAELKGWLRENGVSKHKLTILLADGVIKRHYVNGGTAYYNAEQVKRDVLDPLDGAEAT